MWEKVKSRSHKPVKIFPFGPNSNEVMIYGSVEYEFKAGGSSGLEWAARGTLEEVDGKVVWSQYQVFMVSKPFMKRSLRYSPYTCTGHGCSAGEKVGTVAIYPSYRHE